MKTTSFLLTQPAAEPISPAPISAPYPQPERPAEQTDSREWIRHILFGSPETVRRTIHQLHTLGYVNATLWSPPIHPESHYSLRQKQTKSCVC